MKQVHLGRKTIFASAAVLTLVLTIFGATTVLGQSRQTVATAQKIPITAKRAANIPTSVGHAFSMSSLPKAASAAAKASSSNQFRSFLGVSPKLAQAKTTAAHNSAAPAVAASASSTAQVASSTASPALNTAFQFQGMQDSATICKYFGGCQPPDMAVASSPTKVLQLVNTSYQLYTPTGATLFGPIDAQTFNGVPNPSPAGCDTFGNGAFLSDPRAFYDPNTGYFFTAFLQVEGAPGFGIAPGCNFVSKYWIAAINASTLSACVYNFNMSLDGINAADYTQLGFNKDVVAFSGNMFNATTGNYSYAETGFVTKAAMEKCKPVTPVFFSNLTVGSVLVDTVNPVDTETPTLKDPGVEYLVNAFNMNGDPFGDDCFFTACHGFVVWAYDPATEVLSGAFEDQTIPADNYISPPNADQPICTQCVETIDTRVTATPVYSVGSGTGLISFSIDTGANNNIDHTVPAILWGQLEPALSGGQVFAAGMFQSGYLVFAGDQDASFGAMMQDKNGRMVMVFDTMSATINPSIMYTTRLASDPLGSLRVPKFLFTGPTPTFDSRWGDFEAASYDGFSTNHMWVASQYSIGDWATFIARLT